MFKRVLSTAVLSVSALGMMAAQATGVYVTGQLGYANTHMGSKTNINNIVNPIFSDIVNPVASDKNLSNNGLAGRLALGYQFNQNFAVEAGYLQLGQKKYDLPLVQDLQPATGTMKLQQNAIDFVGKGIIPLANKINVYGKLGVAYLTTNVKGIIKGDGIPNVTVNLNDQAQIDQHKWAPEAAVGVSYDITPNVSLDTSWTHIQPLGSNKPGNIDFVAVGLGYNFG
jgi:OmpA-OmpF porin, OOP family